MNVGGSFDYGDEEGLKAVTGTENLHCEGMEIRTIAIR